MFQTPHRRASTLVAVMASAALLLTATAALAQSPMASMPAGGSPVPCPSPASSPAASVTVAASPVASMTVAASPAALPSATPCAPMSSPGTVAGAGTVTIKDFSFQPAALGVAIGTAVTWTNDDTTGHTVTADDGSFDSGTVAPGTTFSQTFSTAGTFAYHCNIHPSMTATITVG